MTSDFLERLRAVKEKADDGHQTSNDCAAYVADRKKNGWSDSDVDEYRIEVKRIATSGTPDEKQAAREFWALKRIKPTAEGINERIRQANEAKRLEAA